MSDDKKITFEFWVDHEEELGPEEIANPHWKSADSNLESAACEAALYKFDEFDSKLIAHEVATGRWFTLDMGVSYSVVNKKRATLADIMGDCYGDLGGEG